MAQCHGRPALIPVLSRTIGPRCGGWRAAAQPARALPQSAPVRQQEPLPKVSFARKRPFNELELDWFEEGSGNDPKQMAAVAQMMAQAGKKDVSKVKRLIDEAKDDYKWPAGELKSTPKAASNTVVEVTSQAGLPLRES